MRGQGRGGDSRATRFEAIFSASYPGVLAYVLRRADGRSSAEEVVSETFLIAWRRFDAMPEDPLPWLLGVARKVLANQRRSARRHSAQGPRVPLDAVEVPDPGTGTPEAIGEREAFANAFAMLRPCDREVLALVAWEGLEPREAAKVMGVAAPVFSIRLHRARRRLLKELKSSGHSFAEGRNQPSPQPRPGTSEAR